MIKYDMPKINVDLKVTLETILNGQYEKTKEEKVKKNKALVKVRDVIGLTRKSRYFYE